MQLTDARDAVAARGFDGLAPARSNLFLNTAKSNLEDFAPWPWLEASTSGAPPFTIADLKTVLFVYQTSARRPLDGQQRVYLRDMYGPDLTIAGTARFWYLEGLTSLKVFPADTSSLSVDYLLTSPELSADSDEPLFPSTLDQAWIDLACVEAYMDADEPAMAQATQAKAEARLTRALDTYFDRNHQNAELQPLTFSSEDW